MEIEAPKLMYYYFGVDNGTAVVTDDANPNGVRYSLPPFR